MTTAVARQPQGRRQPKRRPSAALAAASRARQRPARAGTTAAAAGRQGYGCTLKPLGTTAIAAATVAATAAVAAAAAAVPPHRKAATRIISGLLSPCASRNHGGKGACKAPGASRCGMSRQLQNRRQWAGEGDGSEGTPAPTRPQGVPAGVGARSQGCNQTLAPCEESKSPRNICFRVWR